MPPDQPARRPPGLYDVAKLAGVSHQTVSRVLNNHPSIRESTRERVQQAIDELGYRPNRLARALKSNRSLLLGVLSASSSQYGPSASIRAIEVAARRAGYFVITVNVDSAEQQEVERGLDSLLDHAVEGLVVIAPELNVLEAFTALKVSVPFVTLQSTADSRDSELSVDQIAGARAATRHLLDLGHRAIAHLSGPSDWFSAQAREAGFAAEMTQAGLAADAAFEGDWSATSGYERANELLALNRYTAVFCANDQMALGLLRAADERGIAVPTDLSVIGFDDMPEAAYFHPPLTTMRQDFDELGRRSVELLLRKLAGTPQYQLSMQPELVVRASTARSHDEV
ncbi:LacI family DNA-binding transcriptional regulator [Subtercola endophyticus]|uniref:LacI family DNA-binding transcriptional regulator n=1 Tax=Subtercola endophyticus TaxID=2895559 RepID=UPI001E46C8CA|nr:LacI family DNA-binding transcriptional regulator [Subtercola endophyticus]UFS59041.1 LacI family DNA-binding transcriptional regulator [Subtercola endophyticus]